jgi:hypothetical protein
MIYRTVYLQTDMCLQTLTHIQLKNKLWTTVAFLRCFHKWQVEKIRGRRHRATLQNYKANWTSLLTNEKAKSTFTRRLLCPNRPPTWALQGKESCMFYKPKWKLFFWKLTDPNAINATILTGLQTDSAFSFMKMSILCTWNLSYLLLSILKVIFLESNPLQFIETLISFIRGFVYIHVYQA